MKKLLFWAFCLLPSIACAMKMQTQIAMFPDQELRAVISGEQEISKNWFAWNVLQHPERDTWIPLYVKALENQPKSGNKKKAKELLEHFVQEYKKHQNTFGLSDDVLISIERSARIKKAYQKSSNKSEKKRLQLREEALKKINDMHVPVADFHKVAKDRDFIMKMKKALRAYNKHDPEFNGVRSLILEDKNISYEHQRIVDLPGCQRTWLVPHPHTEEYVGLYFECAMQHKVRVLVTLCSPYEDAEVIPFWEDREVKDSKGQIIQCTKLSETVLYQSPKVATIKDKARARIAAKKGGVVPHQFFPRVVERRLLLKTAEDEHEVVHLHYENWPDHQEAPDIDALCVLFDRRDSLVSSDDIVMLNCKATIGRSGVFFITDWGRKCVSAMAEEGVPFSEMKLNYADMLRQARRFRPILSGNPTQMGQVFTIIAKHYENLKANDEK